MLKLIFLANTATTIFMTGVIWTIQIVHYPLFARVGALAWSTYHAEHNQLITLVVLPAMVVEAVTAGLLLLNRPATMSTFEAVAGFLLIVIIWGATILLAVPQHNILAAGFDENAHRLLVTTNWIRTLSWTVRTALTIWLLWKTIS